MNTEHVVLSGGLTDNIGKIQLNVKPEFFEGKVTQKLYQKMVSFFLDYGRPITKEALLEYSKTAFNNQQLNEIEALVNSLSENIQPELLFIQMERLIEGYKIGQYKKLGEYLSDKTEQEDLGAVENNVQNTLAKIKMLTSNEIICEDFMSKESIVSFKQQIEKKEDPSQSLIVPTGIEEIDKECGGGSPGELWLYTACTGHGKSTMLLNHAHNAVVNHKMNIVFISAEMIIRDIKQNFHAIHAYKNHNVRRLDTRFMRMGRLDPETKRRLFEAGDDLEQGFEEGRYGKFVCVQALGIMNIRDIHAYCEQLNKELPIHAVFIDYFTKLPPIRSFKDSIFNEHSETISYAQKMAVEFNKGAGLLVVGAHQINTPGFKAAKSNWGVHQLSYLSMTAEAQRAPDVIISIFNSAFLEEEGDSGPPDELTAAESEMVFAFIKNRSGRSYPSIDRWFVESNLRVRSFRSFKDTIHKNEREFGDDEVDIGI